MVRSFVAILTVLALSGPSLAQAKAPAEKQIAELITKLGDSRFEVRRDAHKALVEIGKPALPQLRKAAEAPDVEIRVRAMQIIAQIEPPPSVLSWGRMAPRENSVHRRELTASMSPRHQELIRQYFLMLELGKTADDARRGIKK
ncbi:MAG: hypothetical protein HY289_00245 [Planctomycetes bacterium]|nr:hypothetical protein [Planctomycetota bacterium]